MSPRVGVCSWSLLPASAADLAKKACAAGVSYLQLALDPIRRGDWRLDEVRRCLAEGGLQAVSGMMAMRGEDYTSLESIRRTGGVRLDEHWAENLRAARDNAALAGELSLPLVTFHAGFLPHLRQDPIRGIMLERLQHIIDVFEESGVRVGLETGQENAATLREVLEDLERPRVGVNFDPANMILYGMGDPVEAVQQVGGRIVQIHVKDARPSTVHGSWGTETRYGEGSVDWVRFFDALRQGRVGGDWIIERESGHDRVGDVGHASLMLKGMMTAPETRR